ncbi:DUF397 domain-containing protein [Kitasatospora sp. NPDC004799]|uniref:DUF397 domain-containing protein n=1 Tax=Kitasatospora sp. NPDC004799 TaxID=3154460 RepID=UPI0033A356FC
MSALESDLAGAAWRRSSYSGNGGQCVEMAAGFPNLAPIRDSKDPHGPALLFPSEAWASFVAAVRSGEFGEAREGAS